MFGQDRTAMRRFFHESWKKKTVGEPLQPLEQMVADIIAQHPEYHAVIEDDSSLDKDYAIDAGQTNPFLHMGMHISLAEQLSTDRPAGIRTLHLSLSQQLGDPHKAEHEMMECLGEALWQAQRSNQAPDEAKYLECIKKRLK